MKRGWIVNINALIGALFILTACTSEPGSTVVSKFVSDLRSSGANVETPSGSEVDHGFSVQGTRVLLGGEDVYLYGFASEQDAAKAAEGVAEDGTSISKSDGVQDRVTFIDWTAPPHFYRKGQLIVLYAGDNPAVRDPLEKILGEQFAGQ